MSVSSYAIDPILGPVKRCPKCGEDWPADAEFYYPRHKGGSALQSWCRACWSEYITTGAGSVARRIYRARKRAAT